MPGRPPALVPKAASACPPSRGRFFDRRGRGIRILIIIYRVGTSPVKMTALGSSGTDYLETVMRDVFLALTTLIVASGGNTAFAQYDCPGGQRPVPPAVAERMALPLCGFDATKRWAGNMCQLCDSRNMYPNPFVPYPVPRSRYYGLR